MKAALVVGTFGVGCAFWIGMGVLDLGTWEVLRVIVAANASGFASLLLILKAERVPWIRRRLLTRSLMTWIVFVGLYHFGLLAGAPALRELRAFTLLILPAILSCGFTIVAFGPVQDRIVAGIQRRSRAR